VAKRTADLDNSYGPCNVVRDSQPLGLGQTAPNPVLTTLNIFRHEYEQQSANTVSVALAPMRHLQLSPCETHCPF